MDKLKKNKHQIGVGGLELSEREKELVNQVLNSNRLTYGPMSKELENKFSTSHACKYGLFMNSGTSALQVALQSLKDRYGWADGDEVIVPAITFVATANIVLHNNMTPIFVDVESDTYNIDPKRIEEKITDKTRAIIPVHLLGLPADMDPIMKIAKTYRLAVIEDSCEAMFAEYKDQKVGSIGDIGCFSTYVAHFLVTGVGGFSITNNPDIAIDMRSLMNHGRDNIYIGCNDDDGKEGDDLQEVIDKRFSFVHVGHSFRATEMEAAIGLGQLERMDEIISKRKIIAERFTNGLKNLSTFIQLPSTPKDRTHSFMLYGVVVKNDTKKELVRYLEDLNIETRDLLPIINQPIYKRLYGNLEDKFPIAKWINESGFYIGCHSHMKDEEVEYVIKAFQNFYKNKNGEESEI
jgi:perosamine synthetase